MDVCARAPPRSEAVGAVDHTEEVAQRVARYFQVPLRSLRGSQRSRRLTLPRQVGMFLVRERTGLSLHQIGQLFGNRDHTTVMHAVSRVAELMQQDAAFAEDVELLRRMLET